MMKSKKPKEEKMKEEKHNSSETVEQEANTSANANEEHGENNDNVVDESSEWKDKFLRLYSEFENYKKRTLRERIDLIQSANEQLLGKLLPVLDDFDRAMASLGDSEVDKAQLEGTLLIYNKFKNILEQGGLKPMDAKGKDFDTDFHEALTNLAVDDKKLKGKVIEVIERGYFINDKVLRYAKVVVGA